jgi:UDPglucose 6-dehydrogenase
MADKIAVIGCGFVGVSLSVALAISGYEVLGVEVDAAKLKLLQNGQVPFFEHGLGDLFTKAMATGNLSFSSDYSKAIAGANIIFAAVGTPSREDGSVNLDYLEAAAREASKYCEPEAIWVTRSTVPVGTGRKLSLIFAQTDKKVAVVSSPEFLAEGSAMRNTFFPDRIIAGSDSPEAARKVIAVLRAIEDQGQRFAGDDLATYASLYSGAKTTSSGINAIPTLAQAPARAAELVIGLESAELIKVSSNSFLAMKISFANMVARVCAASGADVTEVMDGIGLDKRIGRDYLYPGLGWGGGCFPKDVAGFIDTLASWGIETELMDGVRQINAAQIDYVKSLATQLLGGVLTDKKITVLGASFKPGTDDVRQSQSVILAIALARAGCAVTITDPLADPTAEIARLTAEMPLAAPINFQKDLETAVQGADLLILATEWPEYVNADFAKIGAILSQKNIIDARNKIPTGKLEAAGYKYKTIGGAKSNE